MTEIIKNLFQDKHPKEQVNHQCAIVYLLHGAVSTFSILLLFYLFG